MLLKSINILQLFTRSSVLLLLLLLNTMQCNGKTVFSQLIPDNSTCPQQGQFGCTCYTNSDCKDTKFLECIDNKCSCEYPLHRAFDESLGKCVSLVGSTCSSMSPECVRNSECEVGRCFCREGYSKTEELTCKISHGEECGPYQCNSDRGLACKEGTCQCIDASYVYSAILTTCLDPEQVVQDFIEHLTERIFREIFNYKMRRFARKITRPFRFLSRFILG